MEQQVVYVQASENDPNTAEIDVICRKMAQDGLVLVQVAPSQGEGGATLGLWLFFARPDQPLSTQAAGATAPGRGVSTPPAFRQPLTTVSQEAPAQTPAYWWHEVREKKGLGLSLTLTGMTSVLIGIMLHYALRHDIIESTFRLGYFFGVVGLLLFLIGLLILF
jgi:hypothetical protein